MARKWAFVTILAVAAGATAIGWTLRASTGAEVSSVYRLPEDGRWARYTMVGEMGASKQRGEFVIRSVGRQRWNEQWCRWIELEKRVTTNADGGNAAQEPAREEERHIMRVFIPEEYFDNPGDPLAQSIITIFSPKRADLAGIPSPPGMNRLRYEHDRFRGQFPPPMRDVRWLEPETVETPAGTFEDCRRFRGSFRVDSTQRDAGRKVTECRCVVWLHDDAPFGLVRMEQSLDETLYARDREIYNVRDAAHRLELAEVGDGAAAELPVPVSEPELLEPEPTQLPPGTETVEVSGRVVDAQGRPLAGRHVSFVKVMQSRNAIVGTKTDDGGRFSAEAPVGGEIRVLVFRRYAQPDGQVDTDFHCQARADIPEAGRKLKVTVLGGGKWKVE